MGGEFLVKGRTILAAVLASALCLACASTAVAEPIAPYDGSNPFKCKTQNVGTGVDIRDPDADPFCVEFDKRSQNITNFGIVDFLLLEPARVAAATPKCFYHQTDHWTGSIVQGTEPTLWHWDGRYFFDKARGVVVVLDRLSRLGDLGVELAPSFLELRVDFLHGGPLLAVLHRHGRGCVPEADHPGRSELRGARRYSAGGQARLP